MPKYIPDIDEPPFMHWSPSSTEAKEHAEILARSIAEQLPVEQIEVEDTPFTYHD